MYHDSYKHYGNDIYKIGWTTDIKRRIKDYTTSYLTEPKFLYTSTQFEYGYKAERILFYLLRRNRIKNNREFFHISLDRAISIIKKLEIIQINQDFNKLYDKMCLSLCPKELVEQLSDPTKVVTYIDKLSDDDFQNMSKLDDVMEFIEQFRFKPTNPKIYEKMGLHITYPEESDIQCLSSQSENKDNQYEDFCNEEDSSNNCFLNKLNNMSLN